MSLFLKINRAILKNLNSAGVIIISSHFLMKKFINNNSTIIDLGANKGNFYKEMIKNFDCNCIAIEASPLLFNQLPKFPKLSTYNFALNKNNDVIKFYLSNNSEANSINSKIAKEWNIYDEIYVSGITLNTFLDRHYTHQIDILKVDIEGAELEILENLPKKYFSNILQIPIEFHDFLDATHLPRIKVLVKKMKSYGFLVVKISLDDWREVLFINNKKLKLTRRQRLRLNIIHNILQKIKHLHKFLKTLKKI
jgi:FkbM family methyltransferase